ncbi:phage holin family protein [Candidatus Saccharibacteria bacterium]|nr:phage holin family protein [Candidatus Saccharibacteria bacterium]
MIKKQISTFILRWFLSVVAMFVCIRWFAHFEAGYERLEQSWWYYVVAGLVFALVNSIVRPIATLFALPFLFITLGLFTVIVNAGMVGLTIWIMPHLSISFGGALEACLLISLMNFLVNLMLPDVK